MSWKTIRAATLAAATACVFAVSAPAAAQESLDDMPILTEYHFAPGRYMDVVKQMAQMDQIRAEAQLPPLQYFWHVQGDAWNLMVLSQPAKEGDRDKFIAARKKLGIEPQRGAMMAMIASHIDTIVMTETAAERLAAMEADD